MTSKLRVSLVAALALAAAGPAFGADRGADSTRADDVDYGDAPAAAPWLGTIPAERQDDSRMQPPQAAPGTETQSGETKSGGDYDFGTMRPAES